MTQPIRLLLVEDNPGDADLTRDTLEDSKLLLDISLARDGAEALDYLLGRGPRPAANVPDLIILDLNLPKMNGHQVLAEIRTHTHLQAVPVVILTSSDAEKDIAQSYQLGANCYVAKPIDLKAFQSIVKSIENFWFSVVKLP